MSEHERDVVERLRGWIRDYAELPDEQACFQAAIDEITRFRASGAYAVGVEDSARAIEKKHTNNVGMVHPMAESDARAIRALSSPGGAGRVEGLVEALESEIRKWEDDPRVVYPDAEVLASLDRIRAVLRSYKEGEK